MSDLRDRIAAVVCEHVIESGSYSTDCCCGWKPTSPGTDLIEYGQHLADALIAAEGLRDEPGIRFDPYGCPADSAGTLPDGYAFNWSRIPIRRAVGKWHEPAGWKAAYPLPERLRDWQAP